MNDELDSQEEEKIGSTMTITMHRSERSSPLDIRMFKSSHENMRDEFEGAVFDFVAGNSNNAALYRLRRKVFSRDANLIRDFEVVNFLRSGKVRSGPLQQYLEFPYNNSFFMDISTLDFRQEYYYSLLTLAKATQLYRTLPGATVSMGVTSRPLHAAKWPKWPKWAKWVNRNGMERIISHDTFSRAEAFACIAMFESGTLDIDPNTLESVMAISSGNSIYVADALLRDPVESCISSGMGKHGITRILGNLDRPGVVMLVPPQAPLVRAEEPDSWRLVNHNLFDNKLEESFTGTSLHLSSTEYEIPLSVPIGAVDAEATMLESLLSVFDRGRWIADLDILGSLRNIEFFHSMSVCNHNNAPGGKQEPDTENVATQMGRAVSKRLVAIDNWEELLDPPERLGELNIGVVRGGNNWLARLALMSVSVQNKHRTIVIPTKPVCIPCGAKYIRHIADFTEVVIT